jgi:sugar phosphate permease
MKILITINIFIILAAQFLIPLWGHFVQRIGGDVRTAGIAVCIFSIVTGLFTLLSGKIIHKTKNEEQVMIITSAIISICYLGYLFVNTPIELYIIQIILGLCGAFQCTSMYSLYNRYMPRTHSAYHWSIWNAFYFIGAGVAALSSAFIAHNFGFNWVFVVLFTISIIALILTIIAMPKINKKPV